MGSKCVCVMMEVERQPGRLTFEQILMLLFKLYGDLNPNTNRRVACYRLRSGSLVAREAYTHIGLTIDACKSVLDDRSSGLRGQ